MLCVNGKMHHVRRYQAMTPYVHMYAFSGTEKRLANAEPTKKHCSLKLKKTQQQQQQGHKKLHRDPNKRVTHTESSFFQLPQLECE